MLTGHDAEAPAVFNCRFGGITAFDLECSSKFGLSVAPRLDLSLSICSCRRGLASSRSLRCLRGAHTAVRLVARGPGHRGQVGRSYWGEGAGDAKERQHGAHAEADRLEQRDEGV